GSPSASGSRGAPCARSRCLVRKRGMPPARPECGPPSIATCRALNRRWETRAALLARRYRHEIKRRSLPAAISAQLFVRLRRATDRRAGQIPADAAALELVCRGECESKLPSRIPLLPTHYRAQSPVAV